MNTTIKLGMFGPTNEAMHPSANFSQLLTTSEAADQLRISRARLYKWIMSGELKSCKVGAQRRVPQWALDEFVARLMAETN